MNIVLSGFMGSGKTTIGKALSNLLDYTFIDMDDRIEQEVGMPIPEFFSSLGEAEFRYIESKVAKKLGGKNKKIIATGGGALLTQENVTALKENGKIIFLDVPIEDLIVRIEHAHTVRPLAKQRTPDEIIALYNQRLPIYQSSADIIVDADDTPLQVAKRIVKQLKNMP